MKILAIALIAGIMAMSAFGCGNSGKNKDDSSATVKKFEDIKVESTDNRDAPLGETIVKEVSDGEKDIENLKAIGKSDDILVNFTLDALDINVTLAKKGGNIYSYSSVFGIQAGSLLVDGQVYLLNNANKVYCIGTEDDMNSTSTEDLGINGAFDGELMGAWDVEIDGGTFRKLQIKLTDNSINCLYLYDGELKYIVGYEEEAAAESADAESDELTDDEFENDTFAIMNITAYQTKDIDDSYFQLPDDYTEVTYDEYYEMMYGDLGWDEDLEDTEVEVTDELDDAEVE